MSKKNELTIGFVSTYIPQNCGIATFTDNLLNAIKTYNKKIRFRIIAVGDIKYQYPDVVKFFIHKEIEEDYIKAAAYINNSDIDIVILQHEFNIYGGFNGGKVLTLLKFLKKPVVMIMHTVPIFQSKPFKIIPKRYKSRTMLLKKIFNYINNIAVMSDIAKDYIIKKLKYKGKIVTIPHGAPEIKKEDLQRYRTQKELAGFSKKDFVITTFGLISPQKGLEFVIKALPKIIKSNPNINIKYLIAGRMHPKKPKNYLVNLKNLSKELNLDKNVIFESRYLTYEEIYRYLANTDIYITPYYRKEQSSSGTLSYAIVSGCCIVSTPYIYAYNLIKYHHVGEFIKFKNSRSIVKILDNLIKNPQTIRKYQEYSLKYAKKIYWSKVVKDYINFINKAFINKTK